MKQFIFEETHLKFHQKRNALIEPEHVPEEDITNLVSIEDLDGLEEDDILDALETIYGETIMTISVDELFLEDNILETVQDYQQQQEVVVFNSSDNVYWSCGNFFYHIF